MTAERLITRPYGALELKQTYQPGLLWGLLAAGLLHFGVLWILLVYGGLSDGAPLAHLEPRTYDEGRLHVSPPVKIEQPPPPEGKPLARTGRRADHGTIVLAPDSTIFEQAFIPTRSESRGRFVDGPDSGGARLGDSLTLGDEPDWVPHIPEFGEFVFVSKYPEPFPNQPKPEYSELARLMRAEGTVVLSLLISDSGNVLDMRPLNREGSISPLLVEAAMEAVREWKFIPAVQNGRHVAVWLNQAFKFKLE